MRTQFLSALGVACCALVTCGPTAAQNAEKQPLWEVGFFGLGLSQQAYPGSDQQVQRGLAVPYFIYRGEFLRADRGSAGLRAIKTDTFELDVGFAGAFGSSSQDIRARQGMPDLGTLVEFGPRVKWQLGTDTLGGRWRLELPVRGVFDLSDGAARRGTAFEPELNVQWRSSSRANYSLSLSAVVGDQSLAQTFYGVTAAQATSSRMVYTAQSGLMGWRAAATYSRPLGTDWRVFTYLRADSVAGAANEASPLVRKTSGLTAGIGVSYTWLRSSQGARD